MSTSVSMSMSVSAIKQTHAREGRERDRRFRVVARTQSQGQFSHYTCLTQKASAEIRTIIACVSVREKQGVCVCNCVCVPF